MLFRSCVLCSSERNLHIHHIFRKSQHRDKIVDPNNLITLCEYCHFYSAHGGNTNTIDFEIARDLLVILFKNSLNHLIPNKIINKTRQAIQDILK